LDCRFGEIERNITTAVDLMRPVQADLFVLPELFNTGYLFQDAKEAGDLAETVPDGPTCRTLTDLAVNKSCLIVAGLAEREGEAVYNSSVLVGPQGLISRYRKIHLFNEETLWFSSGPEPFNVNFTSQAVLGTMICFDWFFPESMRSLALLGTEVVCHPANLVLPYCQDAMVTRCLENGVFAITANRIGTDRRGNKEVAFTGRSQITGPDGERLYSAPADEQVVGTAEIDPTRTRNKNVTPYNHLIQDRRPDCYHLD
jgi:predicted amidohydrolase